MSAKPRPVHLNVVCSECALPWDDHGDKPTLSDCIGLLKAELARRPKSPNFLQWPYYPNYPSQRAPYIWGTTSTSTPPTNVSSAGTAPSALNN